MNIHIEKRRPVAAYPYHIYLGETHVVKVKKGGLQVGIYLITPTLRRRGVVLPLDAWIALQNSAELVNIAVGCAQASVNSNGYRFGENISDGYGNGANSVTPTLTGQDYASYACNGSSYQANNITFKSGVCGGESGEGGAGARAGADAGACVQGQNGGYDLLTRSFE